MKVLITDPLLRKTFDVVNILKTKIKNDDFIYASSKSINKVGRIYNTKNTFLLRKEHFDLDLKNISETFSNSYIVYMPIEEDTTISFYNFTEKFGDENFIYKLPLFNSFNLSRNKDELNQFCENNNISCPKYYSEIDVKSGKIDFPVILKPINGSGSKGIKFIISSEKLYPDEIDFNKYFFQELLDNPRDIKAGFFICNQGEILSFYSHERIRTFPEKGGVSVFSKSTYNIQIKKAGGKIIKKLNWSGFIMIEFLQCKISNDYKLIEINPRLWGSVLLSQFCNANFLFSYIALCKGEEIKESNRIHKKNIRWVFPYDFIYFLKNPQNPFKFFKIDKDTCYVNFTYSNFFNSIQFIFLTYFNLNKFKKMLFNE